MHISKEPLDREAFRRSCRSDVEFRLEKNEAHDRCYSNINGIHIVQVWVDPGWVILGTSKLLTYNVLAQLVVTIAKSLQYTVTADFKVPAGFTFRNDDGTEYYANGKGLAF